MDDVQPGTTWYSWSGAAMPMIIAIAVVVRAILVAMAAVIGRACHGSRLDA